MIRLKNLMNEKFDYEHYDEDKALSKSIEKVQPTVDDIEKATDRNDHNEAVLLLAKLVSDNKVVKIMKAIKEIHKLEGSMPHELIQYRDSLFGNLMEKVKTKYGTSVATVINSAF